ncbi:hypothetical protein [Chryseobacterium sp.]|uniref:hypothetical protein n=1 Tax=Chryseobacterium sp. TaxID=1871047 RepID=UPI003219720F
MKKKSINKIFLFPILLLCLSHMYQGQKKKDIIKSEEIIYYTFDKSNNPVRRNGIGYDEYKTYSDKGLLQEKSILLWNNDTKNYDQKMIEKYYYKDTLVIKVERFDYVSGEKHEEIERQFNTGNKLKKKIVRSFDDGKEIFRKNLSFYSTYEYGNQQEKEKVFEYDESSKDFKLIYTSLSSFDKVNNLLENRLIDSDNEEYEVSTYAYNKNKKIIKKTTSKRLPSIINYSYNLNNDITLYSYTSGDYKNDTIYTYKYDNKGNWIEKTETEGNEKYLITRKIEYY